MSHVHLAWELPFCQDSKQIQTHLSLGLRITGLALGILAVIVGSLILFHVLELGHLSNSVGWTLISLGTFLIGIGIIIKCVKTQNKTITKNQYLVRQTGSQLIETESIEVQKEPQNFTNLIISKNQAPDELINKFPDWILSHLDNVPFIELPNAPVCEPLKNVIDPIVLFSGGPTSGIYFRLKLESRIYDQSYVPTPRNIYEKRKAISSVEPIILPIIVWWPAENKTRMELKFDRSLLIKHRNVILTMGEVLEIDKFYCNSTETLNPEVIEQFTTTQTVDDLKPEYQQHLGWVLLRLLMNISLIVREKRTDSVFYSDKPAVGYWKLSVDKK